MKLPFSAKTASGDRYEIEFPLHEETANAVRVRQLLSDLLAAIDKDIALSGELSNGDVLQAAAMAMAVRARMIHAPRPVSERLSQELLRNALDAVAKATCHSPQIGNA